MVESKKMAGYLSSFHSKMFDACIIVAYVLISLNVSRVDAIPLDKQYGKQLISIYNGSKLINSPIKSKKSP